MSGMMQIDLRKNLPFDLLYSAHFFRVRLNFCTGMSAAVWLIES